MRTPSDSMQELIDHFRALGWGAADGTAATMIGDLGMVRCITAMGIAFADAELARLPGNAVVERATAKGIRAAEQGVSAAINALFNKILKPEFLDCAAIQRVWAECLRDYSYGVQMDAAATCFEIMKRDEIEFRQLPLCFRQALTLAMSGDYAGKAKLERLTREGFDRELEEITRCDVVTSALHAEGPRRAAAAFLAIATGVSRSAGSRRLKRQREEKG